jgi:cell division protein FtsL
MGTRWQFFVNKPVSNEHLVRQVDRRRNRELALVAVTALTLAGSVLAYGWQHFQMIRLGYRMEELRQEREALLKVHRQLELERAALASPDRIEAIARRRLGMAPPEHGQIAVLEVEPEGVR